MRLAADHLTRLRSLISARDKNPSWAAEAHAVCGDLTTELVQSNLDPLKPTCQALRHLLSFLGTCDPSRASEVFMAMSKLIQAIESSVTSTTPTQEAAEAVDYSSKPDAPQLANDNSAGQWNDEDTVRMVNETRLGELLLQSGRIDDQTLNVALDLQQVGAQRLGDVLVSMGKVTAQELEGVLMRQRELTLRLAGGWKAGSTLKMGSGGPQSPASP